MWKRELNIEIVLNNQDWKVYLDNVDNGHYQIARAGWIGDYVDPNSFLDMWVTDGGNNRTGWGDPATMPWCSSARPRPSNAKRATGVSGTPKPCCWRRCR